MLLHTEQMMIPLRISSASFIMLTQAGGSEGTHTPLSRSRGKKKRRSTLGYCKNAWVNDIFMAPIGIPATITLSYFFLISSSETLRDYYMKSIKKNAHKGKFESSYVRIFLCTIDQLAINILEIISFIIEDLLKFDTKSLLFFEKIA